MSGWLFNPLNAELNPICHLLALLGDATIVVISRLRVKKKKSGEFLHYDLEASSFAEGATSTFYLSDGLH